MRPLPLTIVATLLVSALPAVASAATLTVYTVMATQPTLETTLDTLRADLEQAGHTPPSTGVIGDRPALGRLEDFPAAAGFLAQRERSITYPMQVYGQYFSTFEAERLANDLAASGLTAVAIARRDVLALPIPGTGRQYVEAQIPLLSSQLRGEPCDASGQQAIYVLDTTLPAENPRASVFLGIRCASRSWDGVIAAVAVDPATFTVSYVLSGNFREQYFYEEPEPSFGHPATVEPAVIAAVQRALPNVQPKHLRVFAAMGVGVAYVWRKGTVTAYAVHHAGETWEVGAQLDTLAGITEAEFQSPPADFPVQRDEGNPDFVF